MEIANTHYSIDGTIKYSLKNPGVPSTIEAAFLTVPDRADKKPGYVLCLSSQIGCYFDCRMCANMSSLYFRDLRVSEIDSQIQLVLGRDGNIVKIKDSGSVEYAFMAIGEPLFGTNVIKSIQQHHALVKDTRFAISTVGIPGSIRRLTRSELPYSTRLELSLHFPNDKLRNEWIRSDNPFRTREIKLSIEQMLDEASEYLEKTRGKVTLNYAIIDGINNTPECFEQLVRLIRDRKGFYVKVMMPNHTSSFTESWKEELEVETTYDPQDFFERLKNSGIEATFFKSLGQDILAGCGMMRGRI
jgi:23S rRNA (adenine2503-C2)-methyltransferase